MRTNEDFTTVPSRRSTALAVNKQSVAALFPCSYRTFTEPIVRVQDLLYPNFCIKSPQPSSIAKTLAEGSSDFQLSATAIRTNGLSCLVSRVTAQSSEAVNCKNPRPSRDRADRTDPSTGASPTGSRLRSLWRYRQGPRRLSRFSHPLERRRSRHPILKQAKVGYAKLQ
jgi:hypothetical protein